MDYCKKNEIPPSQVWAYNQAVNAYENHCIDKGYDMRCLFCNKVERDNITHTCDKFKLELKIPIENYSNVRELWRLEIYDKHSSIEDTKYFKTKNNLITYVYRECEGKTIKYERINLN